MVSKLDKILGIGALVVLCATPITWGYIEKRRTDNLLQKYEKQMMQIVLDSKNQEYQSVVIKDIQTQIPELNKVDQNKIEWYINTKRNLIQ